MPVFGNVEKTVSVPLVKKCLKIRATLSFRIEDKRKAASLGISPSPNPISITMSRILAVRIALIRSLYHRLPKAKSAVNIMDPIACIKNGRTFGSSTL